MQFFETFFLLNTFLSLVTISFLGKFRKFQILLFRIGLGILVLHIIFETVRWQIALSYLLFIFLSLLLLKRSTSHIVFRILGFATGLLFIITSAFWAIGMPVMKLPTPSGEYLVGTTSFTIIDELREETKTDDPNDKRELFVEVWYPANLQEFQDPPTAQPLWQELYAGQMDRVSFFMNYLKGVATHSYPDVPPNSVNGPYPVILFNHGLQMFTSQNTLLMEHLTSHGYIIVSIAHPYESLRVNLTKAGTVLPEFITSMKKFNEAMAWIEKTSRPIRTAKDSMENVQSREIRARIMLRAIKNSELNQVVSEWVDDNRFVLDLLMSSYENEFIFNNIMDTTHIGIMGMSIGGATATEFCKADNRIKAGINVDGLQYGTRNNESLKVPFMMIYSNDGLGTNDFLQLGSKDDFYEYHFLNTRHADFTDLALVWPIMRMYGQLGDIPSERMIHLTNKVILNFWNHYLKKQPFQNYENKDYPELKTTVKYKNQF